MVPRWRQRLTRTEISPSTARSMLTGSSPTTPVTYAPGRAVSLAWPELMAHGRVDRALLGGVEAGPHLVARPREVVHHRQGLRAAPERLRQRGVRGTRARELGGGAGGRHDAAGEQRAERGDRLERAVAVPEHGGELVGHPPGVRRGDGPR